jgi:kinetochore protein Spc7/SPC105
LECVEEIKAAERVREECRGWSTTEVGELKGMYYL